ncbi:MAG: hypothetical protein QXW00_03705 [Candidatus Woesearchaeota archaeon]
MKNENEIRELEKRYYELSSKVGIMEWDISRNQLNRGKKEYYERLKNEMQEIKEKLEKLRKE